MRAQSQKDKERDRDRKRERQDQFFLSFFLQSAGSGSGQVVMEGGRRGSRVLLAAGSGPAFGVTAGGRQRIADKAEVLGREGQAG